MAQFSTDTIICSFSAFHMLLAAKVISFEAFFHNLPLNSYFVVALLLFSGGSNYDGEVIRYEVHQPPPPNEENCKCLCVGRVAGGSAGYWRLLGRCSHIKSLPAIKTSATNKLFPS